MACPHQLAANFQEETSVNFITGLPEILIYPNPAQDKLWIEFDLHQSVDIKDQKPKSPSIWKDCNP